MKCITYQRSSLEYISIYFTKEIVFSQIYEMIKKWYPSKKWLQEMIAGQKLSLLVLFGYFDSYSAFEFDY